MGTSALIVARDQDLAKALGRYAGHKGWGYVTASQAADPDELLRDEAFDLVLIESKVWGETWPDQAVQLARAHEETQFVVITESRPGLTSLPDLPLNLRLIAMPLTVSRMDQALGEQARGGERPTGSAPAQKRSRRGLRLPIRLKITLPFVILALAMAAAAGFIVVRLVFDSVEERFTNQLIEAGRLSSEWMVDEEDRLLETARTLARTEGMSQAIRNNDRERIRRLALPVAVNSGEEAIEFLDAEGLNLVSMRRRPDAPRESYEFSTHADLSAWDILDPLLAGEVDQWGDKRAGLVLTDWGDYFYVGAPIYDDAGDVTGAVLVGRSVASLTRRMREATLAQVSIYRPDGQVLASTFLEPQPIGATGPPAEDDFGQFSYVRSLTSSNIDYREILGLWEAREGLQMGMLGISLPENFLVRSSRMTRAQIAVTVGLSLIMVLIVGFLVADRITSPLLHLVRASRQVAEGNLRVQVPPQGDDEVAALTSSFNAMVNSLRDSRINMLYAYDSTLEGWSKALELRDNETEGHTRRVAEVSTKIGRALGLKGDDLIHLRRGAILHDIGKMGIPDRILLKPASLTKEEWEVMRKHPVYAYHMLSHIDYLRPALNVPLYHHERWNGSGYPKGMEGDEIPISARIFAVADVYDALLSDRPYRQAWSLKDTLEYIKAMRGKQFDPAVVDLFFDMIRRGELELREDRT